VTASREKQVAQFVGNLASISLALMVYKLAGLSWPWVGAAVLAGVVNVAGYIEGQASIRRYLDGER
jgi:hypothetical protein